MTDTTITAIGNLVADPELRMTPSGVPVANFVIASTPRYYDKQAGEWKDGEALFLRASTWRSAAEHVGESLHKGDRVIARGNLKQRSYEAKTGERRTVIELEVTDIGPSLAYATATVSRVPRNGGGGNNGGGYNNGGGGFAGSQPMNDPWGDTPTDDAPPF